MDDYPEPLFLDDIDEISCPHCGIKIERDDWESLFPEGASFMVCPACNKKIDTDRFR